MLPKQKNALIMVGIGILLCGVSILGLVYTYATVEAEEENYQQETVRETEAQKVSSPRTITVFLQRVYVDGEISEEKVTETILSMEDFWAAYQSWQLVDQHEDSITFRKKIDDISPLLKANGYFGVDENGTLSIFKGKPAADNVIQSFFQIDMDKLESRQHRDLKNGIPIESKDHFDQVLERFRVLSLQ